MSGITNDPTLPFCPYCRQGCADRPAEWSQTPHQPGGCLSGMHRAHLDKVRAANGLTVTCSICAAPICWTDRRTTHLVCEAERELAER